MKYSFNLENKGMFYLKSLSEDEVNESRLLCDECVGENLYGQKKLPLRLVLRTDFSIF